MSFTITNLARHSSSSRGKTRLRVRFKSHDQDGWFDSHSDPLPSGIEPLIFHVGGVYYYGSFDSRKQLFRADEEMRETVFRIPAIRVYWKPVR